MDKACIQNNCYPKHMLRVQLSELDFDCFKPRRFDIRTPPTDQHLSTAECLAFVLSRIEEDNKHTIIYDTIMRPLDLMVQQWHSFSDRTAADRKQKRQITTSQNGGAAENHRNKRSRTLIDTPEM